MNAPDKHLNDQFGEVLTTAWPVAVAGVALHRVKPSWKTMAETLRQWHADSVDDPEYLWLQSPNFEEMADAVDKAVWLASDSDPTPDNSWTRRQDAAERIAR